MLREGAADNRDDAPAERHTRSSFIVSSLFPIDRQYGKALEAVQALREGAADNRDKAPDFNRALKQLAKTFEPHPQHRAWW